LTRALTIYLADYFVGTNPKRKVRRI